MTTRSQPPLGATRLESLDRVSRAFHHAVGFERTVRAVGECLIPSFADLVILALQREDADPWLEVVHAERQHEAAVAESVRPLLPVLQRLAQTEVQLGRGFRWIRWSAA